jgi:hypothetical protein
MWLAQGVALALLLSTAWSLGRLATGWLRLRLESGWERLAVSIALGLAVLGQVLGLLAAAGRLRVETVAGLAVVAHLVAAAHWRAVWKAPSRASTLGAMAAAALLVPCFALTLFPPHTFDELTYHLPFARGLAATGHLNFHDELRIPVFPQQAELLQAALHLTGGETAAHLVQFAAALATCGLLLVWVGRRPSWTGLLAAAAFFGGPIVVFYAATGSVDLVLALFVTLSVWALERWDDGSENRWAWATLSGFAAGSAAAVKYIGLFFVVSGVLWLLFSRAAPTAPRRRMASLARFSLAAAVAAAPTYLWIFWVTGNPLFPFLAPWLGSSAWVAGDDLSIAGAGWRSLLWPLDAVFARANVGWQPPYHAVFLLALVAAIWGAWRERRARALAVVAMGWTLMLPALPADSRYGLPALPLWLAAAAVTLARWPGWRTEAGPRGRRPVWLLALVAVVAASGPAYALSKMFLWGPPPAGRPAAERFLARRLPEFELIRPLIDDPAAGVVYLYGGEHLRGVFRGPVLGDWMGPYRFSRISEAAGSPSEGALCRVLESWSVRHFVWLSRVAPPPRSFADLGKCFEELRRDRHGVVLRVGGQPRGATGRGSVAGRLKLAGLPGVELARRWTMAGQNWGRRFFGVALETRTWGAVAYVWLAFPLGLAYFIFLATALPTGLGLLIVWIGLAVLALALLVAWFLVLFERVQCEKLLGAALGPARTIPARAGTRAWLRSVAGSSALWKGLLFLFLKFPLGLTGWVFSVVSLSVSLGFLLAPVAIAFGGVVELGWMWIDGPVGAVILSGVGLLLFFVALHLHRALGEVWKLLAVWLLVAAAKPASRTPALSAGLQPLQRAT